MARIKKIKHICGYGTITAILHDSITFTDCYGDRVTQQIISLRGNHERGLELDDYDAEFWLFNKFVKKYDKMLNISYNDYEVNQNGVYEENCDYTFTYKKSA